MSKGNIHLNKAQLSDVGPSFFKHHNDFKKETVK